MNFIANVVVDLVGDALGTLTPGPRNRRLEALVRDGELLPATIDGLRVRRGGDTADEHWVSVTVRGATGPFRASVRQSLIPHAREARLGTAVLVRHLDGRIAVDWPASLRALGVALDGDEAGGRAIIAGKTLKRPLPPGIDDDRLSRKQLARGVPARARVTAVEDMLIFGMPTMNKHLHLAVDDHSGSGERPVTVMRAYIPDYAAALVTVGAVLPVAVDRGRPDKLTIDWATAAEAAAAA
jgi:hypothetical protein